MRAPPAVAVHCTGGWPWRLLHLLLPALSAGVAAGWALLHLELSVAPAFVLAALALLAGWRWWRPQPHLLQWDGQQWTSDGTAGRLQLMADLGFLLLLRLHPERGPAPWLAVTSREAGPAWHALRAAVYSRPPETPAGASRRGRAAD